MDDLTRAGLVERCRKLMFVMLAAEHIEAAMSDHGGWSSGQLKLIGVDWPPAAGWKAAAIGRRLPGSNVAAFIELRNARTAGRKPT